MKVLIAALACTATMLTISCTHKAKDSSDVNAKADAKAEKVDAKDAEAKAAKADKGLSYVCIVKKDTRLIELEKTPERCEVHYTKFGDKAKVAWAESTPSLCGDIYAKIRTNIESKGFECKSDSGNEESSEEEAKKEVSKGEKSAKRDAASIKQ